jgi:hypothetical protein
MMFVQSGRRPIDGSTLTRHVSLCFNHGGDFLAGFGVRVQGLGYWSREEYSEPQPIALPGRVLSVSAGAAHALVIVEI